MEPEDRWEVWTPPEVVHVLTMDAVMTDVVDGETPPRRSVAGFARPLAYARTRARDCGRT